MKRILLIVIICITGLGMTGVLGQNPQPKPKKPDTTKTMKKDKPRTDTMKVKPTTKKKAVRDTQPRPRKDRPVDTVYKK